jgi:heme-degrading monooxygenase HmoA
MITRIVKMTFHPEFTDAFVDLFRSAKPLIEAFDGCSGVELMRDTEQFNIYFTFSSWVSNDALANYRQSELFNNTWGKAKELFSDRPEAWSIEKLF